MTLPGFDTYPATPPSKTAHGYLAWLAGLDWPTGWSFWALAGTCGRSTPTTEWVYLIRDGQTREAVVDLTAGKFKCWGGTP